MPDVGLRLAGPADLEPAASVTLAAYAPYLIDDDPYAAHLADTAARARAAELWVASWDDRVVGTVTFCPPGSAMREIARPDEGEMRMLAVHPDARGRGLARALVERCLRRSRDLGLGGVRISSLVEMHEAHRLYESLGFLRAPEDDWSPAPGVRLIAYALPLR